MDIFDEKNKDIFDEKNKDIFDEKNKDIFDNRTPINLSELVEPPIGIE